MNFIGHKSNWDQLVKDAEADSLAHAYTFYGLNGIGKKLVAITFVQWLFCTKKNEEEQTNLLFGSSPKKGASGHPCGECGACLSVAKNNHPDFYLIVPEGTAKKDDEKKSANTSIKIEKLRTLKMNLQKTALSAPYKVVVIDNAQEMTTASANSILKIIEEPPAKTLFILITPHLSTLLPTIRSRCRKMHFQAPALNDSAELLARTMEKPMGEMLNILKSTDGSLGLAMQLGDGMYDEMLADLKDNKKLSFHQITILAKKWVDAGEDLNMFLELMKKKFFDHMIQTGNTGLLEKIDPISKAQMDIERNVNKTLVLENLLMEIM